jgi:hypothetical protein
LFALVSRAGANVVRSGRNFALQGEGIGA